MKFFYLVLVGLVIISCKTQNQKSESDTSSFDSITVSPEPDEDTAIAVSYCSELAKEILKSSPRYKKLTEGLLAAVKKNGGTSVDIILDKSPNPQKDNSQEYSKNFEMQVSENYPDRRVNIAHFTLNPANNQLYEYDVVRDQLIIIEYDRSLLDNAGDYCK